MSDAYRELSIREPGLKKLEGYELQSSSHYLKLGWPPKQ